MSKHHVTHTSSLFWCLRRACGSAHESCLRWIPETLACAFFLFFVARVTCVRRIALPAERVEGG